MKRWLIVSAALLGLLAPAAAFWQSRDSNYNVAISGGGGTTPTTWDPAHKSSGITLSGGNLVATNSAGGPIDGVRSVDSTSGKVYFEIVWTTYTSSPGSGNMQVGIGNASATLTTTLLGQATAAGYRDDGLFFYNFGPNAGGTISGLNDNVGVAIDVPHNKMWVRVNGGLWDNTTDNPATNTGGVDFTGLTGPVFAITNSNNFSFAATAKFDPASFSFTPPSGFGVLGH